MKTLTFKLKLILSKKSYRFVLILITISYLSVYLSALGDIVFDGRTFGVASVEWTKMFKRSGYMTFEPIFRISSPWITVFLTPINLAIGLGLSLLVGLNLTVTILAFRQPKACDFNRSVGFLASVPGLLAGGACCAPTLVLILGLQMSTMVVTASQFMIPIAFLILLITLILILNRTQSEYL